VSLEMTGVLCSVYLHRTNTI